MFKIVACCGLLQFIGALSRFCMWIQCFWKALQHYNFFVLFLDRSDAVELPIKFIPQNVGCYHCWILLKSSCDVRVYEIECVVNTDHAEAELEFVTPAYQPVIQDIPIVSSLYY